jgi:alpha-L-rhamnosidase
LGEQNALTITLADGWYRGSVGCWGKTNVYGRETALLCQVEIIYKDGKRDMIVSDENFSWSNDGPIRFADLEDGEIYDALMSPSYSGKVRLTERDITPTTPNNVYPTQHEEFTPTLITTKTGKKLLDFGQNIAGYIAFRIKGKKGQKVTVWCNEVLDENGDLIKDSKHHKPVKEFGKLTEMLLTFGVEKMVRGELQPTPKQQVVFICSGGEDYYKMEFGVFGFQYVEVETDVPFKEEDFKAIAVYSDMERTGDFECSNAKVNRFFLNTVWSMKSNFLDIPTDCPTRERLGWTGDGQVFFGTAAYLMDIAPFYRKWLRDFADAQFENGKISAVIPYAGMSITYDSTGGSVGWADAVIIIPYRFWKRYGDASVLDEFYDMMRKYAMYLIHNTGHKDRKKALANPFNQYVYEKGVHLGEWLEPEEVGVKGESPISTLKTEECTAYLHYSMTLIAEIAAEVNQPEDAKLFAEYAQGAKNAYDYLFLKDGIIDTDRQAKLVRPLALGLLDGEKKKYVQKRLVQAVENRDYRIGTGFLSTPFVLPVLTEAGHADIAYKMLENEKSPSWLAEVKAGATTVWEDWEGEESRNHYSPGAVCEWLFNTVAGIKVDGENKFVIEPVPGGSFIFAKAEYASLYGKVSVRWEKTEGGYRYEIIVPPNTIAEVVLTDGTRQTVTAGTHTLEGVIL